MTTINCTSNCIHQKDGKCTLESTKKQTFNKFDKCAYFQKIKKSEAV